MSCTACGHENPGGNRFCGGCGVEAIGAPRQAERLKQLAARIDRPRSG